MEKRTLGELVKLAKGSDRTLKEYEKDSGVDAAVISKIISGKYIPQKAKIFKDLTSVKAAPRGKVTYEQLADAAKVSAHYQTIVKAGMAATDAALTVMGGVPVAMLNLIVKSAKTVSEEKREKIKRETTSAEEVIKNIQQFVSTATALLYGNMAKKGFHFKPEDKEPQNSDDNIFDIYVKIENQEIAKCIFKFLYLEEGDRKIDFIVENTAKRMLESLIFLPVDEKQKVSLVVNCKELFNYLMKYKNKLSYKGTLSVIYVDADDVRIVKEEYIAMYDSKYLEEYFYII